VRFALIETEKARFPVAWMCRVKHVSRWGFYARRTRPMAARMQQNQSLALSIAAIYAQPRPLRQTLATQSRRVVPPQNLIRTNSLVISNTGDRLRA